MPCYTILLNSTSQHFYAFLGLHTKVQHRILRFYIFLQSHHLNIMRISIFPIFFLNSDEKGSLDESDQFLKDPLNFATNFSQKWSRPSHIVVFDSQEKPLKEFLASQHFKEVWHFYKFYYPCPFRCSKYVWWIDKLNPWLTD